MALQKDQGFTLIELIVVVVIIATLAIVFLRYSDGIVGKAERAALESISRSFANTMGSLRGQWIVEGRQKPAMVILDNQPIYLNEFGWPTRTTASDNAQTAKDCQQLWAAITQNPTPTTIVANRRGAQRWHISVLAESAQHGGACRYELAFTEPNTHYFDYNLKSGRVDLQIPPFK